MRFTFLGAPVRVSFLLLAAIIAGILWSGKDMLSPLLALAVHELGHLLAAAYMK